MREVDIRLVDLPFTCEFVITLQVILNFDTLYYLSTLLVGEVFYLPLLRPPKTLQG
jgi:hypothetical protein